MLRIHAVPSFRDCEVRRAQKTASVVQNEIVDLLLVEYIDIEPVLMRIPQGERAVGGLRNQRMNPPAIVFGSLLSNAPAQGRQRSADLKGRIKAQRKSGGKRRAKLPFRGLSSGSHHLQLATD